MTPRGRATTPEERRAIVERILRAWDALPELRLGQLLVNAKDPRPSALFFIEDDELARAVEAFAGEREVTT